MKMQGGEAGLIGSDEELGTEPVPQPARPSQFTNGIRLRWWPRVPQAKIRRLYLADAQGILDDELIDAVGFGLYQRCGSILIATEAHDGRATCPRCGGKIPHEWQREAALVCQGCGWQTTWEPTSRRTRASKLHGGGAQFAFKQYHEEYPKAATPRERWLLIGWLLHVFHHELIQHYSRPAACNLIEGRSAR